MRVIIPSSLRSYTGGLAKLDAAAPTVADLLKELDRRFPGIRFRVVDEQDGLRPHIRISVNAEVISDLATPLRPEDEVALIQAFSGG